MAAIIGRLACSSIGPSRRGILPRQFGLPHCLGSNAYLLKPMKRQDAASTCGKMPLLLWLASPLGKCYDAGIGGASTMNSIWLVITAVAAFLVAYRFYGAFLAAKVAVLNDSRVTPAHRLRDDVDYHPTRRLVLFGVHFAAIAGSGPLVGPVLASQWGYFPGFCWIVIGSCLAGGVHDFIVLLASVRQDGQSLPKIARDLLGPWRASPRPWPSLFIVVTTLAATAKVVVNALNESAWGMFTIVVTIPAALLTGFWMNKMRPGKIAEASPSAWPLWPSA